jgi:hypothetical protein
MGYNLEGRLLEVCTCDVICPCWVGEDPDGGRCDGVIAWRIDQGTVNATDVSGLTLAVLAHIPGNVLKGNWRALVFVDERATPEQEQALLGVWTGKLGGPVADLVQLVGEVIGVERAPVTFTVQEGRGTLRIGEAVDAQLAPLSGPTGQTTLRDSIFSTIPGSPAFVAKAARYRARAADHGFDIDLENHNAIQGTFKFEAA